MVYLYYEGMDQNLNAEIVVAYDGAALLSEGATNVLYGNGHVQWITFEEFRRSLETSRNIEPRSATIAPDSPAGRMFGTSEAAP
jgi:hypothetical protein